MSGPKRNADKLNTIGIVVVGICGAVLVYVTIVALQAFYLNNSSDVQTMADYGGNDVTARSIRSTQVGNIGEYGANTAKPGEAPTSFRLPIDQAMKLVVEGAKTDPSNLVPVVGKSDKATVVPVFGRPKPTAAPAGTDAQGGAGAGSAAPAGSADPGAGSAAAVDPGSAGSPPPAQQGSVAGGGAPMPPSQAAPQTPTAGQGPGGSPPTGTTPTTPAKPTQPTQGKSAAGGNVPAR